MSLVLNVKKPLKISTNYYNIPLELQIIFSQVSRITYPRKMHPLSEKRVYMSRVQLFLPSTDGPHNKPAGE